MIKKSRKDLLLERILKRKRIGEPPFSYEEVHMLNITKFLLSGEFALVVRSHEQVFLYYDAATAVEKALFERLFREIQAKVNRSSLETLSKKFFA